MDDLLAVSTLLQPGETNFVGWRVATNEPVNAWRSESPGNLHLYFRVERFEQAVDAAEREAVLREPMTEDEYRAALGELADRCYADMVRLVLGEESTVPVTLTLRREQSFYF